MIRRSTPASLVAVALLAAAPAAAQDLLGSARAQYTAADYDAALLTLNQMRSNGLVTEDVPAVEQYRALCLLALGRSSEAEEAMAAAVAAVPSFSPSGSDVSPRVRSTFIEVKRRVLPGIIQQRYAAAKAAFDRKDFMVAGEGFTQVLSVLDDADLASAAARPPLSDMRTLAKGFRDLSASAAAAVVPTPSPPRPATPAVSAAAEKTPAPVPAPLRIYSLADKGVVAPVALRQLLPPYPRRPLAPSQGILEVVISENGTVESSAIRKPIEPLYDRLALEASRGWRYRPATKDGTPVKFRKLVQVKIQP